MNFQRFKAPRRLWQFCRNKLAATRPPCPNGTSESVPDALRGAGDQGDAPIEPEERADLRCILPLSSTLRATAPLLAQRQHQLNAGLFEEEEGLVLFRVEDVGVTKLSLLALAVEN